MHKLLRRGLHPIQRNNPVAQTAYLRPSDVKSVTTCGHPHPGKQLMFVIFSGGTDDPWGQSAIVTGGDDPALN
ncbi:hypothetical protein BDV26DRAFT_265443 [Aspergillus bertholletiae]|uniref:Uncharacterized protein n=1 Tax=Aspergillus bertholletiae TaxID=1226010 RepID=A0A5N7B319_9EURO|nr:hypothetical protein BDV26DRAFT_265443 [Aspergillus bertholletiae]